MRGLLLVAVLPFTAAARADPLTEELTRGVKFLQQRLAADPDDFVAANQLGERLLRRAAWSGSLEDLRSAEKAAISSLRAAPAEQNAGGLALMGRIALAMHRFRDAKEF